MPEIYPIAGGKGGVGKSFIAASLGTLLAKRGKHVVLVDLDLGVSNLHTLLGIKNPKSGIHDFLDKSVKALHRVAVPTTTPNLFLISSSGCSMEIANLFHAQKLKLITAIKKLPYDYILLDLGAGTNFNTLDFFLTAKEGILICTPEPTSIENAFSFIKAAYFRRLKQIIKQHAFHAMVKDAAANTRSGTDILDIILKYDPKKETLFKNKLNQFQFKFIINQFRKNLDPTLGPKIETVCNRHFYSNFQFLGNISYDERIHEAIVSKSIYIHKFPYTTSSIDLKTIADKISKDGKSESRLSKIS